MANRWLRRALAWLFFGGGGGVAIYVVSEGDVLRGLAFVVAAVLLNVALLMFHEDIKRARGDR